jgi:hypothetical protein
MLCWSMPTCREPAHVRALVASDDLRGIIDSNATAGELLERIAKSTDRHVADVDRRSTFIKQLTKA